jgi:hypothetical protein
LLGLMFIFQNWSTWVATKTIITHNL